MNKIRYFSVKLKDKIVKWIKLHFVLKHVIVNFRPNNYFSNVFSKSFFEIHKVDIIDIFMLLKTENEGEIDISGIIFVSAHLDRYKFALAFIRLATVCKLFTLEVIQKCQLRVFRKTRLHYILLPSGKQTGKLPKFDIVLVHACGLSIFYVLSHYALNTHLCQLAKMEIIRRKANKQVSFIRSTVFNSSFYIQILNE